MQDTRNNNQGQNYKLQATNYKQITITKITITKTERSKSENQDISRKDTMGSEYQVDIVQHCWLNHRCRK